MQALEELGSPGKVIGSSATGAASIIWDVSFPGADQWTSGMGHTVGPGTAVQSESQGRAKAALVRRCRRPRFIPHTVVAINLAVRTRKTCFSSLAQKLGKSCDDTGYNCFIAVFSIENYYYYYYFRK